MLPSWDQNQCTPFNTVLWAQPTNRQDKEAKDIHTGKKTVKVSLFAHDMIIYGEIRKLVELANEFSKVPEYKLNMQKSFYLYVLTANNRTLEFNNTICIHIKSWNI